MGRKHDWLMMYRSATRMSAGRSNGRTLDSDVMNEFWSACCRACLHKHINLEFPLYWTWIWVFFNSFPDVYTCLYTCPFWFEHSPSLSLDDVSTLSMWSAVWWVCESDEEDEIDVASSRFRVSSRFQCCFRTENRCWNNMRTESRHDECDHKKTLLHCEPTTTTTSNRHEAHFYAFFVLLSCLGCHYYALTGQHHEGRHWYRASGLVSLRAKSWLYFGLLHEVVGW